MEMESLEGDRHAVRGDIREPAEERTECDMLKNTS